MAEGSFKCFHTCCAKTVGFLTAKLRLRRISYLLRVFGCFFDGQVEIEKNGDGECLKADKEAGSSCRWQGEQEDNVLA